MNERESLYQFLRRHRVTTGLVGAAFVGIVDGLSQLPFYAVLASEAVYVFLAVPWVMLGGRDG